MPPKKKVTIVSPPAKTSSSKKAPVVNATVQQQQQQQQQSLPAEPTTKTRTKTTTANDSTKHKSFAVRAMMEAFIDGSFEDDFDSDIVPSNSSSPNHNNSNNKQKPTMMMMTTAEMAPPQKEETSAAAVVPTKKVEKPAALTSSSSAIKKGSSSKTEEQNLAPPPLTAAEIELLDATAELLHGMFLIGKTNAVQSAPRVGSSITTTSVDAAASNNTNTNNNVPPPPPPPVRLHLRPTMVAAVQAVVPSKIIDADVIRRVCNSPCVLIHQQHQQNQQNSTNHQHQDAAAASVAVAPNSSFSMCQLLSSVGGSSNHNNNNSSSLNLGNSPLIQKHQQLYENKPMPTAVANAMITTNKNTTSTETSIFGSGLIKRTFFFANNNMNNSSSSINNVSSIGSADDYNTVVLRSPLPDVSVPTTKQLIDILKQNGFKGVDGRMIWFGTFASSTISASNNNTTSTSDAAINESHQTPRKNARDKSAGASPASAKSTKSTKTAKNNNTTNKSGSRRARTEDKEEVDDEDEDDENRNDHHRHHPPVSSSASSSSSFVPHDLLQYLSDAKQKQIEAYEQTSATHIRNNTDRRIKERRNLETLVATLNVVRSAVGAVQSQAGVVSVLRAISRSLNQRNKYFNRSTTGDDIFGASSTSLTTQNNNTNTSNISNNTNNATNANQIIRSSFFSSASHSASQIQLMSAQSAGVVICDEAVTQLRLLLSTLKAVCYFEPMSMVSLGTSNSNNNNTSSIATSSPFKNRHESISSVVDTKTAFASDEDHQNAKREKSIVDFDNEVKRVMAFGGSGNRSSLVDGNENSSGEIISSSSSSSSNKIRYELMSGLIIFPHSADAKLKRSQFVSEISEKIAKLL